MSTHPSTDETESDDYTPEDESDGEPEQDADGPNPLHPELPSTDPTRRGPGDPIPNRGVSDLQFSDLAAAQDDVTTLFDRVINNNPHTCPNCFSRLSRQWELPNTSRVVWLESILSSIHREEPYQLPEDERSKLDDRFYQTETFTERVETEATPAKHTPSRRIAVCENCGHERRSLSAGIHTERATALPHVDGRAEAIENDENPYAGDQPIGAVIRAAETISDTLREYGIPHSRSTLLAATDACKRIPSFTDKEAFRTAVIEAVNVERLISGGVCT